MQCRKVEPNVIMNSVRLVPRSVESNKLEEEIVHVVKSPEKKSPHNGKSLKRTTSGPIINLQQQIIIQSAFSTKNLICGYLKLKRQKLQNFKQFQSEFKQQMHKIKSQCIKAINK